MRILPDTNLGKWLTWTATLTALAIIIRDYGVSSKSTADIITHSTVSGLLLFFVFLLITREIIISRKEKYANIGIHTHRCIHLIRDFQSILNMLLENREKLRTTDMNLLQDILTEFADIFTLLIRKSSDGY